jgi:hypothetical protein
MDCQAELHVVTAAGLDRGDFEWAQPKELLDFKFREPGWNRFDPQKSQSPSLHMRLPLSEDCSMAAKKSLEKDTDNH